MHRKWYETNLDHKQVLDKKWVASRKIQLRGDDRAQLLPILMMSIINHMTTMKVERIHVKSTNVKLKK